MYIVIEKMNRKSATYYGPFETWQYASAYAAKLESLWTKEQATKLKATTEIERLTRPPLKVDASWRMPPVA